MTKTRIVLTGGRHGESEIIPLGPEPPRQHYTPRKTVVVLSTGRTCSLDWWRRERRMREAVFGMDTTARRALAAATFLPRGFFDLAQKRDNRPSDHSAKHTDD